MKLYVGNLNYATGDEDLRSAFAAFGDVDEAVVISDRETNRSRGFGFVEMPDREEAQAAIEGLNGKELAGRTLTVNEARARRGRS
jgi:RNA recognition motif-containing protein